MLLTSPFTSYTPSIFSRIARILPAVSSQVHAGTYNLTTRAVSGTTLVVICCVVAHESRNRVKRKMAGNIFFLFIISSFLRTRYTYPSTLLRKQPIPLLQQKRDIFFDNRLAFLQNRFAAPGHDIQIAMQLLNRNNGTIKQRQRPVNQYRII
jgi:hypothetical protein